MVLKKTNLIVSMKIKYVGGSQKSYLKVRDMKREIYNAIYKKPIAF